MTEFAQRDAVRRVVIMAHAPWLGMGGIDYGVAFRSKHFDTAERTAMIIKFDNSLSKPLVTDFVNIDQRGLAYCLFKVREHLLCCEQAGGIYC